MTKELSFDTLVLIMIDAGDLPSPTGKDLVVGKPGATSPAKDASGSLPEHLTPEQRFLTQLKRWLHPDSPNTVSVRLPDKIDHSMPEPEVIPGRTQRFTFVNSPDGQMEIGLFAANPANSEEDPFRLIEVKWLDKMNKKTGLIRYMHFGDGRDDYFGQSVLTSPSIMGEEDIRRWEQEATRTVGSLSPSQHDMRPDLATALEEGIYNDTLTQNALRYFTEQQGATRIIDRDALPASGDDTQLPASQIKAIES